jgi:predicted SnoaL-like aldol condensation-catalyzing enzyme
MVNLNPSTMLRLLFTATIFSLLIACNAPTTKPPNNMDNTIANKALIEQYFKHFNNHEWQKMADMYIDEPEMKDPAYGLKNVKMTKADIVKKYNELQQLIPDVHDRVINTYPSGDCMIVEFESSGTAPDSSKFILPICTIFEIKNGKITKDFTYYDNFDAKEESK